MSAYGKYQTLSELSHNSRTAVFTAKPLGSATPPALVVKVFQPVALPGVTINDAVGARAFLAAAALQRTAAGKRAKHWAPVLDSNDFSGGAYYVTRHYPRSLERLIDGRLRVSSEVLHHVVRSIVFALRELAARGGHAHGNLKATNIFFTGQGPLSDARLVVSDPLPPSPNPLEQAAATAADFKALGSLIFRLVRRRDVRGEVAWPVTASPDWDALGEKAVAWRELCNRLLDPQAPAQGLSWAEVEGQLKKIKFRGVSRQFVISFLILPSVALVAGFGYLRFVSYDRMPDRLIDYAAAIGNVPADTSAPPAEWALLCNAYYNWFGSIQQALQDPERFAAWKRAQVLSEKALAQLKGDISLHDPRVLSRVDSDLQALANNPPAIVLKGVTHVRIAHAWRFVTQVQTALEARLAPAPILASAQRYASAGWNEPANELKTAAASHANRSTSTEAVDDYLALEAKIQQINASDTQLAHQNDVLSATQDTLLSGLTGSLRVPTTEAPSLDALSNALAEANQTAAHWITFVQGPWSHTIERTRFEQESVAAKEQGPVTPERIARWETEVKDYSLAPAAEDPRNTVNWPELKATIAKHLSAYRAEETKTAVIAGPDAVSGQTLQDAATALAQSVAALTESKVIRKDLEGIKARVTQLTADHRALADRIANAMLQLRPNVAAWLTAVKGTMFPDSPVLQSTWRERTAPLLENVTAPQLAEDKPRFQQLRDATQGIEAFLRVFAAPPALPPAVLPSEGWQENLRNELNEWLKTDYENTLAVYLKAIDWTAPSTPQTAEALLASPSLVAARARYDQDRQAASDFGRDCTELAADLAAGKGLDEGVAGVADRATHNERLAALRDRGSPHALFDAVAELRRLATETDQRALVERVTTPGSLAASFAAWRRLGVLPDWPHADAGLSQEKALATALLPRISQANTNDAARQQSLAAEFAREGRTRWRKALRTSTTSAEVTAVFAHLPDYGLQEAELDEFARYAFYLNQLKIDIVGAHTVTEAAAARAVFVGKVQSLPTAASRPDVTAFVATLQQIVLTEGDPVADLRRLGPVGHGWTAEISADAKDATFHWTTPTGQTQTLRFLFVELVNGDPFFLATTETSVGLLIDLVAAGNSLFESHLPTWIKTAENPSEDQRQGPQTWVVDFRHKGRLSLHDRWNGVPMPGWPAPIYPAGQAVPPPTRQSPAQYLDPSCARFIAEKLLDCRLPTPAEWNELLTVLGRDTIRKHAWNLRDKTWLTEQDYLLRAGTSENFPWPDRDIFAPESIAGISRGPDAVAATQAEDHLLWFADVDQTESGTTFAHLLGNVAEYLWDPKTGKYSVAGGSALSPFEVDPTAIYAVDTQQERDGYSDVGFRLAFSAPDSLVGKSRLSRLVRDQGFLSL